MLRHFGFSAIVVIAMTLIDLACGFHFNPVTRILVTLPIGALMHRYLLDPERRGDRPAVRRRPWRAWEPRTRTQGPDARDDPWRGIPRGDPTISPTSGS